MVALVYVLYNKHVFLYIFKVFDSMKYTNLVDGVSALIYEV